ncbi:hypothetical protein PROFUN_13268 [Planoprotostelium fungivorum]|uniref:Uncharacterized protein n=1 Tax=Planoprotostelium fungivorum TaxID=1890364 RepID=A0A2P6N4T2_9EUKA|nr:hypothetical protein PROFUN_13268 [Planoprotostelium fungivorum]
MGSGSAKMRPTQAGPGSSHTKHKAPVLDPGKAQAVSGGANPQFFSGSGGFRATGTAAGPSSAHTEYTATLDPGKASSVSGGSNPQFFSGN